MSGRSGYSPVPGYTVIAEIWDTDSSRFTGYEWASIHVLRRDSDGRFVWFQDSGCSCYYPFYDGEACIADFIELDRPDSPAFIEACMQVENATQRSEFMAKVRALFTGRDGVER